MRYLIVLAVLLMTSPALAQVDGAWGDVDTSVKVEPVPAVVPVDKELTGDPSLAAAAAVVHGRQGLSRKQRRDMGLSIRNIRRVTAELHKTGELQDMTREEVSAAVLDQLMSESPAAFQDAAIDWDNLLAFIERLIPLILKLIALFGV